MIKSLVSLALLAFLPSALAHGTVMKVTVDGKSYTGPTPGQKMDSIVRMISSINPVTDVTSTDMICGNGAATTATEHAAAKPGSKITFEMRSGNVGALWPHDVGPIMTYMASCGGNSCTDFDASNAKWFKVGQAGYTDPSATIAKDGAVWEMGITYYKQSPYAMTLPSSLPNGAYLLRMESIALHRAQTSGGAEFYPSCSQLLISGGSGSLPSANTVGFPGAYKASDPGILVDIYTPVNKKYAFPGPALFTASGSGAVDNAAKTTTTKAAAATITSPATMTTTADDSTETDDCSDDGSDETETTDDTTDSTDTTTAPASAITSTTNDAGAGDANPDVVTVTVTKTITVHRTQSTVTKTATETVTDSVNLNGKRMNRNRLHARKSRLESSF
jgi:hypothetical protein